MITARCLDGYSGYSLEFNLFIKLAYDQSNLINLLLLASKPIKLLAKGLIRNSTAGIPGYFSFVYLKIHDSGPDSSCIRCLRSLSIRKEKDRETKLPREDCLDNRGFLWHRIILSVLVQ